MLENLNFLFPKEDILAVEKEKRKALEKLVTAGRKCLLVQVGDGHHVYHLTEVTCKFKDLAYYCPVEGRCS